MFDLDVVSAKDKVIQCMNNSVSALCNNFCRISSCIYKEICGQRMAYYKKYRAIRKEVNEWLNTGSETLHEPSDSVMVDDEISEMSVVDEMEISEAQSSKCSNSSDDSHDLTDQCSDDEIAETATRGTLLQDELAHWVVKYGITREAGNGLLAVLRRHGHQELPKDSRTLKKTPRKITVTNMCGGQYIYLGLKRALHMVSCSKLTSEFCDLEVQISVDGLPLFKSSPTQFWPIMCSVNHGMPTLVALFMGKTKPDSLDQFVGDLIAELCELKETGFQCSCSDSSKRVSVTLHSFVCDAPARAFLKNIKGHNSLHACERCVAVGVSTSSRTTFNSSACFVAEKRNSDSFNNLEYLGNHQNGQTPLIKCTDNIINIFSLDYMHLICLGVLRRMLTYWKSGDRIVKLSSRQILDISEQLIALRDYIPSDFVRRPRSLLELDRWKATEFRTFLLYTGPVILKSVLPTPLYMHFLTLSVSLSILLRDDVTENEPLVDFAGQLLHHFVENSARLYGETFLVYNVHSVLHLVDDVKYFRTSLNQLSAFRFENYLQSLKSLIRSASNPLVQAAKRIEESEITAGSQPVNAKKRYKIAPEGRDSTVCLKNGKFATVLEVRRSTLLCKVYKRQNLKPFFSEPCSSDLINIYCVKSSDSVNIKEVPATSVHSKGLKLPHGNDFVLIPLLHQEAL